MTTSRSIMLMKNGSVLYQFTLARPNRYGYTPGIDPDAPNIANDALLVNLNHLACGPEVDSRCSENALNLTDRWQRSRQSFLLPDAVDLAVGALTELLANAPGRIRAGELAVRDQIVTLLKEIDQALSAENSHLEQLEREASERARSGTQPGAAQAAAVSMQTSTLRAQVHGIRELSEALQELKRHYEGSSGELLVQRLCLLRGQWGTGKTHFLCDFAVHRL